MLKTIFGLCLLLVMLTACIVPTSFAKPSFTVGFVSDGNPKDNAKAAYEWAQKNYNGAIIPIPKSKADLEKYGVIWWDECNGASIPNSFLDKAAIDSFLGYVNDGGGLFLSNLAFHYVNEMGLEADNLRYFGAAANSPLDWTDFQIAAGQEKHPIFNNMKVDNGIIQYDVLGYAEGSDFYGAAGAIGPKSKNATVLAQTIDGHPQCNGLVEYKVGSGAIIIIGWVWSSWVINKKIEDIHAPLHANIINYLATKSKFAPVESAGKLTSTWGDVKTK
jgi:hypothetical protein